MESACARKAPQDLIALELSAQKDDQAPDVSKCLALGNAWDMDFALMGNALATTTIVDPIVPFQWSATMHAMRYVCPILKVHVANSAKDSVLRLFMEILAASLLLRKTTKLALTVPSQ